MVDHDWQTDAQALVKQDRKLEAIKLVREATGLGLKEAKDLVDAWANGTFRERSAQPAVAADSTWEAEARALWQRGKKIEAIKRVREGTGLGLKEAKDIVDSW